MYKMYCGSANVACEWVPMMEVCWFKMQRYSGSQSKKQLLCLSSYVCLQRKPTGLINLWTEHHNKAPPAIRPLTQTLEMVRHIIKNLSFNLVPSAVCTIQWYAHMFNLQTDWRKGNIKFSCFKGFLKYKIAFIMQIWVPCHIDTWSKIPKISIGKPPKILHMSNCSCFSVQRVQREDGGWVWSHFWLFRNITHHSLHFIIG